MHLVYQILLTIILLTSPLIILTRIIKNKEDNKRFIEKFSFPSQKRIKGKLIWFHGASVGELMSILPLIKYYENRKYVNQILITSSTTSSAKVFNKFKFKKTVHQFFPIDYFIFTKKFLEYWKPNLAIFIDSEIWPKMYMDINKKNIPLILLNARLTKKTFKRWMKIGILTKSIFKNITAAFPQNIETKKFLKVLNTKKIKYLGNLKYAESYFDKSENINKKLKKNLKSKKIWVASSTHGNEEIFCAKTHIELKKKVQNLLTILIPRHVHRVKYIIPEIQKLQLKVCSHSSNNKDLRKADIYIVDTFGETKKFHKVGASVFLGGSITDRGGQNPLEAARFGAKILHGPHIDNFKDVYKLLKFLKISKKINSPKKLASSIIFKKNKKNGLKIRNIGKKILKNTIKELNYYIINEFKKT